MKPPTIKASPKSILAASKIVGRGGLVIYPTDTVYGLGCNPFDPEAVTRLLKAKGKEKGPLPLLASSLTRARTIAIFPPPALELASRCWPGPLTIVLKARGALSEPLLGLGGGVGVRVPNHPVALELIRRCGGFLVGTSANPTGEPPALEVGMLDEGLKGRVDLVLDGGRAPVGVSSTVLDFSRGEMKLIRRGSLGLEDLLAKLPLHRQQ